MRSVIHSHSGAVALDKSIAKITSIRVPNLVITLRNFGGHGKFVKVQMLTEGHGLINVELGKSHPLPPHLGALKMGNLALGWLI
ncbi:MAG: hypothetical protein AAFN09_07460 [Pseudomonadota bacterium]